MGIWDAISLLGGIGLFLYGMTLMSTGLKNAAGDQLRNVLERVTNNKISAVLIGLVVTMLIQSSSATDMMVIGFVHSGLMSLSQAVGVIMGANIGTTITAQITAFNLASFAPLLIFIGCIMHIFFKKPFIQHTGSIILGFGMLFMGIGLMKSAIAPLASSAAFKETLGALSHPLTAVFFGIAFTALLQSSSSSIVIFQAFAVEGLLTYQQCVYLVIGSAIGSVTPNLLASLTTGRNGKRTALLNLYFNLFRAVLLLILISVFPAILTWIQNMSPNHIARQIANTHTLFSIAAVICALPMSHIIVKLTEITIPLQAGEQRAKDEQRLIYLVNAERSVPSVALKQAMLEVTRMGHIARDNLNTALTYFFDPDQKELFSLVMEREKTIDYLDHAISDQLVMLRSLQLSNHDVFRLSHMVRVVSNFERIGDHAENIVEFGARLKTAKAEISSTGLNELRTMADAVMETLDVSMQVFEHENFDLLPRAEALEQSVDDMQERFIQNHVDRLMTTACNPLGGVIFTDMCTDLERCADQAINIATALYTSK